VPIGDSTHFFVAVAYPKQELACSALGPVVAVAAALALVPIEGDCTSQVCSFYPLFQFVGAPVDASVLGIVGIVALGVVVELDN